MSRIWWAEFDFSMAWSIFRWPGFDFPTESWILRWPGIDFSHFTFRWTSLSLWSWFDYSVDNVWWTLVTAVETLALVAMLCCFFMFCGCTL